MISRMYYSLILIAGTCVAQTAPARNTRIIDLTQPLGPTTPIYPGGEPLRVRPLATIESDGYAMNVITFGEHTGTHVDAPSHFIAGGWSVDQIPAERLVGPGAMIDISAPCDANPDYALTYLDIKRWEAQHGRIPNAAIVVVRTGWAQRWNEPSRYVNASDGATPHFPGVSAEAAEYLVEYRDLSGLGIDTLSIDPGLSRDFKTHRVLLSYNVFHIENVADPARIPPTGATLVVAPLALTGGTGAPCRVLAFVPNESHRVAPPPGEKLLIEFGWDIPDASGLATAAAAGTPFDGAVFDPRIVLDDGATAKLSWSTFGKHAIREDSVRRVIRDLQATPIAFRKHSFLRFNTTPADVGWFEDWSAILANARCAARLVRDGGLAGWMFDVEQYQGKLFDYRTAAGERSFDDVAAQVRRRGAEFVRAIDEVCPKIELILTFGYSIAKRDRARDEYGLLPAFLDGMLAACDERTRIIDGYEFAYPFKSRAAFERGRREILEDSNGHLGAAFGIWLDWNSGKRGWPAKPPLENWFSPLEFESAARSALALSDRYVWIYSERLNWWTRGDLPEPYLAALRAARAATAH